MSRTSDLYDIVVSRVKAVCASDFGDRIYRWDGLLSEFVSNAGIVAGKTMLRVAIESESISQLLGANAPALVDYSFRMDVLATAITAKNLADSYRALDDVTDRLSSGFYYKNGGTSDWSLAGTGIAAVTRGPVTPSISSSADYISRGFLLSIKFSVSP